MKTTTYSINLSIRIYALIILAMMTLIASAQKTSTANGNWNSGSTWFTSGVPSGDQVVVVDHEVVLDKMLAGGSGISGTLTINNAKSLIRSGSYDIEIKNGGTLIVYGTLEVNNLTFSNGSNIMVTSSGSIIVHGSFSNNNNSNNVTIDGSLVIYGSAYNGNGAVISGVGTVSATGGAFTGSGIISGSVTLPVELHGFSAEDENSLVLLKWSTSSEINNDYFTIERSEDGVGFLSIGIVKGAGNSTVQKEYKLYDEAREGITYYRLKQTDFNGHSSYHGGTIVYQSRGRSEIHVYPNPAMQSNVYVKLSENNAEAAAEVVLSDMNGNEIYRLSTAEGNTTITIPQVVLRGGVYTLSVRTGSSIVSKKLIVK